MPLVAIALVLAAMVAAGALLSYTVTVEWRQRAAHESTMRLVSAIRDDHTPVSRYTPRHRSVKSGAVRR